MPWTSVDDLSASAPLPEGYRYQLITRSDISDGERLCLLVPRHRRRQRKLPPQARFLRGKSGAR